MERMNESFVASPGSLYGKPVWYDPRGSYATELTAGTGDFVFHRRKAAAGGMIELVCKMRNKESCPVTARISANGRLIRPPGVHSHLPELGGHGRCARKVYNFTVIYAQFDGPLT